MRRRTTTARAYGEITVVNNIQVGDIVYRQSRGGQLGGSRLDRRHIGLVLERHEGFEDELSSGAALVVPQYKVKFGDTIKWYYELDLHKIIGIPKVDEWGL